MVQLFFTSQEDLNSIISAIIAMIKKYPKTLRSKRDHEPVENPIERIIDLSKLIYVVSEVFDNEKKCINKILQFSAWNDNCIARKGNIYVCWGDEVQIEEDLITVFHREDDGSFHESILRIFPSHKQHLYTL